MAITSVTMGRPVSLAGFGQIFEAFFAQALEAVRRGARLVGAAAQGIGPGFAHGVGNSRSCSRLSTEQGPAMMPISSANGKTVEGDHGVFGR